MKLSDRWGEFLVISAVSLVFVVVLLLRTDLLTPHSPGFQKVADFHSYRSMSWAPWFSTHYKPYGWRRLVPYTVKLLPVKPTAGFLFLACLSIWGSGVLMYYLARAFRFSRSLSMLSLFLFFTFGWATKFVLYDFWEPDPEGYALLIAGIVCIMIGRDLWFAVLMAVSVAIKESALFVAPLYYTLRTSRLFDIRLGMRTLWVAIPALLMLAAIRFGLPVRGNYSLVHEFMKFGLPRLHHMFTFDSMWRYFSAFGLICGVLPWFALLVRPKLVLRFLPFLALVASQLLFASNRERLLVLAFPALIVFTLVVYEWVRDKWGVNELYFLPLPAAIFLAEQVSRFRRPAPMEAQIGLAAAWIVVLLLLAAVRVRWLPPVFSREVSESQPG